jgi:Family of unknown function (DUF6519)
MSFDISRKTFDAWKDYFGVVMQQGRVQMDSDWNEWLAELTRRLQAGTLDILGATGVPSTTPTAFQIGTSGASVTIGYGRMYVDGILVENHPPQGTVQWDPSLAEWSGPTQPPLNYSLQPYYPASYPGVSALSGNGPFLFYLDVWQREVTYLQDPDLVDKAIGIDTTGRYQTVWQVKSLPLNGATDITCSNAAVDPVNQLPRSGGLLTNGVGAASPISSSPCSISLPTGYTGLENQLYRVEIHQGGIASSNPPVTPTPSNTATFEWSRDNASVATAVTAISSNVLTVQSLGRDHVLGFAAANWIEITCDALELTGQAGELHQIENIDPIANTITLDKAVASPSIVLNGQMVPGNHTRIKRWDQGSIVYLSDGTVWIDLNAAGSTGDIPVPPSDKALVLENGVTVRFDLLASPGESFLIGDFWNFCARTADGSVEPLSSAPPRGIRHHYCRLAIVEFSPNGSLISDCRRRFPSLANPSLHVSYVSIGSNRLSNDGTAAISSLSSGLNVVCDLPVSPAIVTQPPTQFNSPICFLTVDLPTLVPGAADSPSFARTVLAATVSVSLNTISLTPTPAAMGALNSFTAGPPLLARLTLKGSAIRAADNPDIYLNGATGPGADGRPYADFEMWFWLTPQPLVNVQPASLNFPNTVIGNTSAALPIQVSYTNSNSTALTISTTGNFAAQVLHPSAPPDLTVPPGDSTISVTFTPTATDVPTDPIAFTGQITFTGSSDASLPVINLTGKGLPVPMLTGPLPPSTVGFGQLIVGNQSTPQNVTVTGNSSLVISAVSSVSFALGDNAPGDYTCTLLQDGLTIQISFTPGAINARTASCQISHNATNVTSPLVICSMTGLGISPPPPPQAIVPGVKGMLLESAEIQIRSVLMPDGTSAGLVPQLHLLPNDSAAGTLGERVTVVNPRPPVVDSQFPLAGTLVDPGSTITLNYFSTVAGSGQ